MPLARPVVPWATPVGQARPVGLVEATDGRRSPMHLLTMSAASVWQDLGIFLAGVALCEMAVGSIAGLVITLAEGWDERVIIVLAVLVRAAALVALVAFVVGWRGQTPASVGLRGGELRFDLPLGLAAMAGAFAAHFLCVGILFVLWPAAFEGVTRNADRIGEMLPRSHPVLLLAMQVVVGFYEELLFRGFLLTRLRRILGRWWLAVLLSSALFAALHMTTQEPVMAIPIFGLGVVFCSFTIWRKSLVPAMIGHALFNSCQLLWLFFYYPDWT